ncbi:MAG TPA: phosphoribosyltransferase family protein [Candidatus Paceibacterota bacterium]|nr:phosphoribosyltransferase family protein [Candidatus Paceibacterota bacterium]
MNTTTEQVALEILGRLNAVLTNDHFVYTKGDHGSVYVNKDAIYPHTVETARLCRLFADRFEFDDIQVVVGPEKGGIILSQWTAHRLTDITNINDVLAVYAEKDTTNDGTFIFARGYEKLIPGKRVLIVEDVLTTGGSVKAVVQAVRALGGDIRGVAAICNRGGVTAAEIGDVPELYSLVDITLDKWSAEKCPLCARDVPINTARGKGKEFLARKNGG